MSALVDVKVMTQNCASFKVLWAVRVVLLVARIKTRRPDILTCVELYATRRKAMTKRLGKYEYECIGSYMGKVIYRRRARGIVAHKGSLHPMKLGNGKHALACRFEHATTGVQFVVVVAHLSWQIRYDERRHTQTHRLITAVRARFGDTPAIYTGDWNSSIRKGKRKRDAVGSVFKARGLIEAFTSARTHLHEQLNSSNRYLRRPPANGVHLDRMFGDGVVFMSWLLDYYSPRRRRPFYGADHFGLVCTVRIPSK